MQEECPLPVGCFLNSFMEQAFPLGKKNNKAKPHTQNIHQQLLHCLLFVSLIIWELVTCHVSENQCQMEWESDICRSDSEAYKQKQFHLWRLFSRNKETFLPTYYKITKSWLQELCRGGSLSSSQGTTAHHKALHNELSHELKTAYQDSTNPLPS